MHDSRILMGMTVTIDVIDSTVTKKDIEAIFDYFVTIDNRFSTYKKDSEISQINRGEINQYSDEMKEVFLLAEGTKHETNGYFDIVHNGYRDPSGIVKGWAIYQASKLLEKKGFKNFFIDAGGDAQIQGLQNNKKWEVGIRNPFKPEQIVKVLHLTNCGIATSGSYVRGQHIYNPIDPKKNLDEIVSMTVIAKNVYEADRFATAAFAMQRKGIVFLESKKGVEGYMIDRDGIATYTSGFETYL